MTEKKLKIRQQAFALTVCTIVFMAVYNLSTWYASSAHQVPSFTFNFERLIPFVPLSIIPYMASGLFFCIVFFSCKNKKQLKILTWRMLFVTMAAGIFFVTVPLRFSFVKLEVSNTILNLPFSFLETFDSPFNQSPSLHIAFAFIFWSVFRDLSRWRIFLMISLVLVGISTLTTYQHHVIDVLTGATLAHVSFIIIPYHKNNPEQQNFRWANYYFLLGWIFISAALFLNQYMSVEGLIILLPALIAIIIGYYHQKNSSNLSLFVLIKSKIFVNRGKIKI
ncbi:phosphatase PAP2 family protein [Chryseobacterium sp. SSA4.19]|uniref:phosphatase PAP2 family protein n=1 Tax=Chryseobacterium sp. SSA4.19 TaxID=2919915 RepID=UPI001F4EB240|nr:phosphatase PAP2 family protein [Chryseobacterium sp. SSA4.19]MCJ8152739.1 phosphatase PAP2 family protein [Chryseobacterium sp. SSA4.19]